jgi:FtsZ-binding cell division protein ZapB
MADDKDEKGGAGGGAGGAGGGAGGGEGEARIPKERFDQVNNKLKETSGRLAALELELEPLRKAAEAASGWQAKFNALNTEHTSLKTQHQAHVEGVKAGITSPKILEHAYREWTELPEKDRKAFGETLQAWREKPDEAPELLRPHFAAGGKGDACGKKPPTPPPANRGAGAPPAPGQRVSVRDMPEEQRKATRAAFFPGR